MLSWGDKYERKNRKIKNRIRRKNR
jgi:hypothetical protein